MITSRRCVPYLFLVSVSVLKIVGGLGKCEGLLHAEGQLN
jgi:hypothetical protein